MAGTGSVPAPAAGANGGVGAALAVHVAVGLAWGSLLVSAAAGFGAAGGILWFGSAAFLWALAARELRRGEPAGTVVVGWCLASIVAPLFAVVAVVRLRRAGRTAAQGLAERVGADGEAGVSSTPLDVRIDSLERALDALRPRLSTLQSRFDGLAAELAEVRELAAAEWTGGREPSATEEKPLAPPDPEAAAPSPASAAAVAPVGSAEEPLPPAPLPPRPRREVDLAELLGARALAWAGGFVTLLGVVFFFVLAVDRGWIGPVERVSLGALASAALLAAGIFARRRYGDVYSAFAATGAGIAGGYATLLAAAALYGIVGDLAALLLAAAIAAAGAALALLWRAQMLAGIGLVGATLVPLTLVFEGGLSIVGTGFVALVFAATAVVTIGRDWRPLLAVGLVAGALQIWLLILQTGEGARGGVLVLSALFVALYLAAGLVLERRGARSLERLPTALVLVSAGLAAFAAGALLNGTLWGVDRQGAALLAAAVAYGLAAALLFGRARGRDLSALLGALALALAAIGLATLLSGASLGIAWSAQAAVLAWLGARLREARYRLASLAYLGLALAYTLVLVAPPSDLFTRVAAPAAGAPSVLAVALAALVFVRYGRGWEPVRGEGAVSRALDALSRSASSWRTGALVLAPAAAVYAVSLVVLALALQSGVRPAFAWGHVWVTALWAAGGGATLLAGALVARRPLQAAGLVLLAAALAKLTGFDASALPQRHASWSALSLAIGYTAVAYGVARLGRRAPQDVAAAALGATAVSGALVFWASAELLARGGAVDPRGLGLAGAAAAFGALGATLFPREGRRTAITAFWAVGLALAFGSSLLLLDSPTAVVAAWSAGAAALAGLASVLGERRLLLGAAALAAAALGRTLVELAPPADLFVPAAGAADGVPALALALAALLALVAGAGRVDAPREDGLDGTLDRVRDTRRGHVLAAAAVLGVYGLSLSILGTAQALGSGDVTTDFQRGHTAVSAFWGLIGLLALRFGLTAARPALKLAGFALFGIALAKLFLYDLTMLSSVTRALSFLAVGAVLLVAGFFYQRLGARAADA